MTIWHFNAAVSLDMKLARPDGSVDWLEGIRPTTPSSTLSSPASTSS